MAPPSSSWEQLSALGPSGLTYSEDQGFQRNYEETEEAVDLD